MQQRRSPALGAAKPSPKVDNKQALYSYDFEIFLARIARMRGCFAPGKKRTPALGAAKPSPKVDKEQALYSYDFEIFLARVARMRGCFAP